MKRAILLFFTIINLSFINQSLAQDAAQSKPEVSAQTTSQAVNDNAQSVNTTARPTDDAKAATLESKTQPAIQQTSPAQQAQSAPAVAPPPTPEHKYWLPSDDGPRKYPESYHRTSGIQIGVGLLYDSANQINLSNTNFCSNNSCGNGSGSISLSPGAGVSLDIRHPGPIGFDVGLAYEPNKGLNNVTLTGAGGSATAPFSSSPQFNTVVFYSNVSTTFEHITLFAGFNANEPTITGGTTSPGITSFFVGTVGYQAGLGFNFDEAKTLEIFYQVLNGALSEMSSTTSINSSWSMPGVVAKFVFQF
jgi:hypothetical protein